MQTGKSSPVFRFGPFEVDLSRREVRKLGTRIRLSGQAFSLLVRLLSEPGQPISREDLRRTLWPDGTFVDFEHSLNAVMNRLRSQLRDSAEDQHYIETLPGVGYRFVGSLQTIVSVEEVGSAGKARRGEKEAQLGAEARRGNDKSEPTNQETADEPAPQPTTALWNRNNVKLWAIIGALSAVVVLMALAIKTHTAHSSRSLVLLPFRNLKNDPEQEFLADGITDAITTELGRSPDLQVISETSAACYKHTSKPLGAIAKELNVMYLVEGSVVPFGDRVRVNVRLVQAQPDRHLWSKSYEIELSEAPRTEADIAQAIASEISAKLVPNRSRSIRSAKAVSTEAYEAYLKGKYMLAKGTEASIRKSIEYFDETIAKAPDYADARAALAESYCALSTIYAAPSEVMPKARQAADIALQLDDNLSEAHGVRGRVATLYEWDWRLAERHLRRAIDLNVNSAPAHVSYGDFLISRGRYDEAFSEVKKAQALDPVSLANSAELQLILFETERFDMLAAYAAKSLEIDPEFPWGHTLLGWVYAREGKLTEGLAHAERGVRNGSSFEQGALLAEIELMAGQRRTAESRLSEILQQRNKGYICAHAVGAVYSALGQRDEALKWLETGYRERSDCMPFLRKDPSIAALRGDPRFQELVRRVQAQ